MMGRISEQLPEILPEKGHLGGHRNLNKASWKCTTRPQNLRLRGSERRFKWRNASTCMEGIISEKLPTTGWGSVKNPQKCSMRESMSLNTCEDQIAPRPTDDCIYQVKILCPFLFARPHALAMEAQKPNGHVRGEVQGLGEGKRKKPPSPLQAADLLQPNRRTGKVEGLCF